MRRARPRDDGAAAVEFALVSVLLFTLLFGIIQYGFAFFQMQAASATVRQAARLAAVGVDNCAAFKNSVTSAASANGLPTGGGWAVSMVYSVVPATLNPGVTTTVTLTWTPLHLGFPFVPFPAGNFTNTAQATVEDLGTFTGNCP